MTKKQKNDKILYMHLPSGQNPFKNPEVGVINDTAWEAMCRVDLTLPIDESVERIELPSRIQERVRRNGVIALRRFLSGLDGGRFEGFQDAVAADLIPGTGEMDEINANTVTEGSVLLASTVTLIAENGLTELPKGAVVYHRDETFCSVAEPEEGGLIWAYGGNLATIFTAFGDRSSNTSRKAVLQCHGRDLRVGSWRTRTAKGTPAIKQRSLVKAFLAS